MYYAYGAGKLLEIHRRSSGAPLSLRDQNQHVVLTVNSVMKVQLKGSYLGTHCRIGSKTACYSLASDADP